MLSYRDLINQRLDINAEIHRRLDWLKDQMQPYLPKATIRVQEWDAGVCVIIYPSDSNARFSMTLPYSAVENYDQELYENVKASVYTYVQEQEDLDEARLRKTVEKSQKNLEAFLKGRGK